MKEDPRNAGPFDQGTAFARPGRRATGRIAEGTIARHETGCGDPPVLDIQRRTDNDDLAGEVAPEKIFAAFSGTGIYIRQPVSGDGGGAARKADQKIVSPADGRAGADPPGQGNGKGRHHGTVAHGKTHGVAANHLVRIEKQVERAEIFLAANGDNLPGIGPDGPLRQARLAQYQPPAAAKPVKHLQKRLVETGQQIGTVQRCGIDQIEAEHPRPAGCERIEHTGQHRRPGDFRRILEGGRGIGFLIDHHNRDLRPQCRIGIATGQRLQRQQKIDALTVKQGKSGQKR